MTHHRYGIRSVLGAAGLALLLASRLGAAEPGAQDEDTKEKKPKAETLPHVVITATKTETEVWRTASSITVVDREKIEREQLRTMVDALRDVPGVAIADRGTPGSLATVLVRGTDTKHTAVLIDGRPVPANLAGSFNLENTPLDNVERIEVLRGPAASLYGGKTIGGVINIITRSGKGLETPETKAFFEAGSYGTFREGVSTRGSDGPFDWSLEASRTDIQGQRINSRYEHHGASGNLGYQIQDTLRFDLNFRHYDAHLGLPGTRLTNDPNDDLDSTFWSLSPRLTWDTTDWWRQTLTYSISRFRQKANTPGNFFPNNNLATVESQFLEYQSEFRPIDEAIITVGGWLQDQHYDRFNQDPPGLFNPNGFSYDVDQNETNWAVFLQAQIEVLPGLNYIPGLRYDVYSDFDDAVTWRQGLSYRVPELATVLHANAGTAFAPPSPQDREPALFGNPNLAKPERSVGFEAGITQPLPAADANFHATYFYNRLRDTYQFDLATFTLLPIGKARTQGLEVGADWRPCPGLALSVDYTYLEAEDQSRNIRLVRRPRHTLSGSARFQPHADLDVTLSALYVMDREDFQIAAPFGQADIEDYLTVRLAANWRICPNFEVFARIENLLGEQYEEAAGFPALDTGAYAGFRLRF